MPGRLALAVATALTACSSREAPHDRPVPAEQKPSAPPPLPIAPKETSWHRIPLYPSSRLVCEERARLISTTDKNAPWREIEWRSYATPDSAKQVIAFLDPDGTWKEESEQGETTLRHDGVRISVFELPTTRPHPICSTGTIEAGDHALIVLHEQTLR